MVRPIGASHSAWSQNIVGTRHVVQISENIFFALPVHFYIESMADKRKRRAQKLPAKKASKTMSSPATTKTTAPIARITSVDRRATVEDVDDSDDNEEQYSDSNADVSAAPSPAVIEEPDEDAESQLSECSGVY